MLLLFLVMLWAGRVYYCYCLLQRLRRWTGGPWYGVVQSVSLLCVGYSIITSGIEVEQLCLELAFTCLAGSVVRRDNRKLCAGPSCRDAGTEIRDAGCIAHHMSPVTGKLDVSRGLHQHCSHFTRWW